MSHFALLGLILVYCVATKIWGLGRPLIGNFAPYQLMLADESKFLILNQFKTVFYPMTFLTQTGEPGLLMLNFQLPSIIAAALFKTFGGTVEFWGRSQMILFTLLATLFLYGFVRERFGARAALWSGFLFNLSPLTLIYGQSFMYEMPALCLTLGAFYLVQKYTSKMLWGIAAGLLLGIAMTLRIHLAVLLLPLCWIFLEKKEPRGWMFFASTMLLPLAWYGFTFYVSQTSPDVFMSLFPQVELYGEDKPLSLLASIDFYRRILFYLARYALTPLGLFILPLALWKIRHRFLWVWLAALAVTVLVLTKKYYDHPFYLCQWIPALAVLVGIFLDSIWGKIRPAVWLGLVFFAMILSGYLAWRPLFIIPAGDQGFLAYAGAIKRMTEPEDRIIASENVERVEPISLAERVGWPFELSNRQRKLPPYFRFKTSDTLSVQEREERNRRYLDPILWIEYLRSLGAKYFFAPGPGLLNKNEELRNYLEGFPHEADSATGVIRFKLTNTQNS